MCACLTKFGLTEEALKQASKHIAWHNNEAVSTAASMTTCTRTFFTASFPACCTANLLVPFNACVLGCGQEFMPRPGETAVYGITSSPILLEYSHLCGGFPIKVVPEELKVQVKYVVHDHHSID